MKKQLSIFKILLIIILLSAFSCNKDDSDADPENVQEKYISKVIGNYSAPNNPRYDSKDTLVYENDKITKGYFSAGCNPSVAEYEYGSNGKITKIFKAALNINGDFPTTNDLINMFENSTIIEYSDEDAQLQLQYDTENRLIKIYNSFYSIQFEYDNQGRLYKKIYPADLTYTVYEFDENDNPLLITRNYYGTLSDAIYTYGTLKNPYYILFKKYSLIDIDCGLEQTFISPNVVTSVGSITYTYYSEGDYPSSVRELYNGRTYIYDFTYR